MRIIAGRWKGHRLRPLKGKGVRPTSDRVREAWMSALGGSLDDLEVVDLFSGSGALGLEALSRGASHVIFVEQARNALRVIESNIESLGARDLCTVVADDVFRYLSRDPAAVDIALADPPYGAEDPSRLVSRFVEDPFARELWLEHRWRETPDLPDAARTRRYGDTAITTLRAHP